MFCVGGLDAELVPVDSGLEGAGLKAWVSQHPSSLVNLNTGIFKKDSAFI